MIKKLLATLFTISLLSACGGSGDSSSGSGTETAAASTTSSASQTNNCAVGRYAFTTVSDGKKHFDAYFASGGVINFNLTGGPTGKWTHSGNRISVTGPLSSNRSTITLNFTVTKVASDCRVMEFRGTSPGGSAMRMYRI